MPAPNAIQQVQEVPLKIVGGCNFGRYQKISDEQTWNFLVSDNFLVPYAGYKNALELNPTQPGRGLYSSQAGNFMLAVIGSNVYRTQLNTVTKEIYLASTIGQLYTNQNDVYIAENNNKQICITDGVYVYIYDWGTGSFRSSNPASANPFAFPANNPGYVSYQNARFIIAVGNSQYWVLSELNNGYVWPNPVGTTALDQRSTGRLQSKPCFIQAVVPVPGGGNNIFVMGTNVAESWQDIGAALFPYQRNQSFNSDFGCLNAASIAALDNMIVWLAVNEQSGPTIMVAAGNNIKRISTDGIDYVLSKLTKPKDCTAFLFKQDGHVIYQFTFITDNVSFAYDFNTGLFFYVSDENQNYHIAREVVFFNNEYYFVSLNGGNVYRFGTQYTDILLDELGVESKQIPRIRITPPVRLPSQRYFIAKSLGFTIENGELNNRTRTVVSYVGQVLATEAYIDITTESGVKIGIDEQQSEVVVYNYDNAVDLSISRDGGQTFGSSWRKDMNPTGIRKSRFIWQRLGIVNDATFQLRFSGFNRFVCTDGVIEIYQ